MDFGWPPELDAFRREVREFVRTHRRPETLEEVRALETSPSLGPNLRAVKAGLESRGWLRISWPVEFGGAGQSFWYQFILNCELRYGGIAYQRDNTASMVGPAIQKFGTESQRYELLPQIHSGEITCALGYSEPDAGSDLASLTLRARRDGDEYVINGQKIWTSGAHRATHVWLAARTDPEAPKHRGISMFLFPLATPGISIRPIWVLDGHRTNEVFYDNVRIPVTSRIGEENIGWYIMTSALDHERVTVGSSLYIDLVLLYESLLDYLKQHRHDVLADPLVRLRLSEISADLHGLRALMMLAASKVADGHPLTKEASMVKVWGTELSTRLTSEGMDILGRHGSISSDNADDAPAAGALERAYRRSPISRFTAGANEVQRNIIAQRGLGLPR